MFVSQGVAAIEQSFCQFRWVKGRSGELELAKAQEDDENENQDGRVTL